MSTSSADAVLSLVEVCFPDCTQKVIRAWGQVVVTAGIYETGGIKMGLVEFADARTVDFNGFLRCDVWDEEVQVNPLYMYHYSPVGDVLQIFSNATGLEYPGGSAWPITDTAIDPDKPMTQTEAHLLLFEASWDRTTVRG